MKNATEYERKVKKLLAKAKTSGAPKPGHVSIEDAPRYLIRAILLAEATDKQVDSAMTALDREFVDLNELRVAPLKELVEAIGADFPLAHRKAEVISIVLSGVYFRSCAVDMTYMQEMPKRDLRRHLRELGMTPFDEALVTMSVFGGHAMPVDPALFEILQLQELVHPESDVEDTQSFLERIVPQKNGLAVHLMFRDYVAEHMTMLLKHRQAEEEKRAAEEAERKKAEEEKARKQAAAEKAKAQAAEKAAAEAEKRAAQAAKADKTKAKKKASKSKKAASKKKAPKKQAKKTSSKKTTKKKKKATTKTQAAKKKSKAKKTSKAKAKKKPTGKATTSSRKKTAKSKKRTSRKKSS